jgi:hypothetical protein
VGNYKYAMDENGDFINILKQGYGNRVTMPFGYHYHAINIKFNSLFHSGHSWRDVIVQQQCK